MHNSNRALEFRVMLAALKPRLTGDELAWLKSQIGDVDRTRLIQELQARALLPLFASRILQQCAGSVPHEMKEQLRSSLAENTRRNLGLLQELIEIVQNGAASGITIVPFKGPMFAMQCYGSPGYRFSSDLDVLIRVDDLPAMRELMAKHGYTPQIAVAPSEEHMYVGSECEFNFVNASDGTLVEAHWSFMPNYYGVEPLPGIWEELRRTTMAGHEICTLSPEHCLLMLAQHATKHAWSDVGLIVDFANWIVANPALDFEKLFDLATRSQMRRMLVLGLELSRKVMSVELPPLAVNAIACEPGLMAIAKQIDSEITRLDSREQHISRFTFALDIMDSRRGRFRYVSRLAFEPNGADLLWLRLPAGLRFLYPAMRVVRLLSIGLRQVGGMLFHRDRAAVSA